MRLALLVLLLLISPISSSEISYVSIQLTDGTSHHDCYISAVYSKYIRLTDGNGTEFILRRSDLLPPMKALLGLKSYSGFRVTDPVGTNCFFLAEYKKNYTILDDDLKKFIYVADLLNSK